MQTYPTLSRNLTAFRKKQVKVLQDSGSPSRSLCRARKEFRNELLVITIRFDTAENELSEGQNSEIVRSKFGDFDEVLIIQ